MIKTLKVSDKIVRKFKSHKSWEHSTVDSLTNIVLEQPRKNGENATITLDERMGLATEQSSSKTKVKIKRGKKLTGTFYPVGHKNHNPSV